MPKDKKFTFEDYLQDEHALEYTGTGDLMVEAFENWLQDISIDEWIGFGDAFASKKALKMADKIEEKLLNG